MSETAAPPAPPPPVEAPARSRRPTAKGEREPCVGLPVQFHNGQEVLPAFLQRQSRTEPALWDLKISLAGAGTLVTRAGVKFSASGPLPGCWNFIPGL